MIKTYLDSGFLIAAARGTDATSLRAIAILDDDQRQYWFRFNQCRYFGDLG